MKTQTTKATTKTTTKAKENKTMKEKKTKKVTAVVTEEVKTEETKVEGAKEVTAPVTEDVKVESPKVEEVKTENANKANKMLNIQEITELYAQVGIKCYNPTAKGNYRIMGFKGGSSLNIVPKRGEYRIYSTDTDYDIVNQAGLKFDDLVIEKGTNSVDKARQNTIVCKTVDTLKALLGIYATNTANKIAS